MLEKDQEVKWTTEAKNSFEKIKIALTEALVLVSLDSTKEFLVVIFSNEFLASAVHLTSRSFFNMAVIYLMVSAKFGMNQRKKIIFPIKDCTSFLLLGKLIFRIAFTLSGSILMPSIETK